MMTRRECLLSMSALALSGCRSWLRHSGRLALNPSTIREFHLPFVEQVRVAVAAGYDGIEPWLKDLHVAQADGTLRDAVAYARDANLAFVNGIAFGTWAHPDAKIRAQGLEGTRHDMALLAEIGCPRIAASMFGVHKFGSPLLTADEIAERYATLLDLGRTMGVQPLLEYWGHSVNLHSPEQALGVLRRVNHDDAALLPDVYHTYRGVGDIGTLTKFHADELPLLHMNDYPRAKSREQLVDADRVWPGDGAADWSRVFGALHAVHAKPWFSLELFNLSYQKDTPLATARTGVSKMKLLCERCASL